MHFLKKSLLLITSIILLFIVSVAIFFYQGNEKKRFVVFFSGTGMKIPAAEIVKDFTDLTGVSVNVHFDGSSVLRQHIETYGDADVFMSGDKANIDALIKKGLVKESAFIAWHIPSILIPPENRERIKGLNDLAKSGIRFVMANPAHAASGRLANEAISRHPKAEEILGNVAVFGSSTADSLARFWDLYGKGRADAVIEWDIMVHVPEGKDLMVVPFEKKYEVKDAIVLALIENSRKPDISKRFYDYFRTEGIKVFKKHGYNTEAEK